MPRANLGELEELVLLALIRLGGDRYALELADALTSTTGRDVSPATTFMVMRRLEQRGLVRSRVDEQNRAGAGRPRRLYRVNKAVALPLLRASRRARLALWDGLEGLLR